MNVGATARDLMREHVVVVEPDDRLGPAEGQLRLGRLRGVPVVEEGRLVGELSFRALTALFRASLFAEGGPAGTVSVEPGLADRPVREAMGPRAGVAPDTPARELARSLVAEPAGYLPVVSGEGRLLGIVTESDLLRAALHPRRRAPDQS